jgi:ribosomal protein S18 acetylase RimI-like enzyme
VTLGRGIPFGPLSESAVRPARATDVEAVAPLLYLSAADMYARYAGGRERAEAVIRRALEAPGNSASLEVVTVAEHDGGVAGALAAYPVAEATGRARAFLRVTLGGIRPWRWPGALRLYWVGGRAAPSPPEATFYVDALAVDGGARRRGLARALLERAEREARELGLRAVSLDTALDNKPARALYLGAGYEEVAYRPPARGLPGFVALVKPLN